jgi:hypothetical protein
MRAVRRFLSWPIRRLLQPWFNDVNIRVNGVGQVVQAEGAVTRSELAAHVSEMGGVLAEEMHGVAPQVDAIVGEYASAHGDALSVIGRELSALRDEARGASDEVRTELQRFSEAQISEAYQARIRQLAEAPIEWLDGATAHLLNLLEGHRGFAAQRGLWLNPPVTLKYSEGDVELGSINERIVEHAYTFRAMSRAVPPGPVLDIGSAESTVSLSLASLGYHVTAIDPRPYPFSHPRLTSVQARLEDWDPGGRRFAAICCISTIEHLGLGWYGEQPDADDADVRAMNRLHGILADDGFVVLTVPYGKRSEHWQQRTYDRDALDGLLAGWQIEDVTIVVRSDALTWVPVEDAGDREGVALVVARPRSGS